MKNQNIHAIFLRFFRFFLFIFYYTKKKKKCYFKNCSLEGSFSGEPKMIPQWDHCQRKKVQKSTFIFRSVCGKVKYNAQTP